MSGKYSLDGQWRLYLSKQLNDNCVYSDLNTIQKLEETGFNRIIACVPGNYELDLMKNGEVKDFFFGKNMLEAQEFEDYHLWYCRTFECTDKPFDKYFLFKGIDTFADIYLNGLLIGSTDNMFIEHEIPAHGLKTGLNEIVVHISPVMLEARKKVLGRVNIESLIHNVAALNVRKAAHMFGWDIAPRILSGGIWRSVYLVDKKSECIDEVYLYTKKIVNNSADVAFYYNCSLLGSLVKDYSIRVSAICEDSSFECSTRLWHSEGVLKFSITEPKLWWPKNMGMPNLYDVKVELLKNGEIVDEKIFKTGIRTVTLDRTGISDEHGNGEFCFYINDTRFFAMGTNWVPLDAFHSRDKERMPRALALMDDIGCNMVRCWGGNVYEDDEFFDFCDEHGITVWQDFAMACGTYPQDDWFCSQIKNEAEFIVKKLRHHPSIVVWAGDNECDDALYRWGDPNKNIITRKIIPSVLEIADPLRPYLPSSPYIDSDAAQKRQAHLSPEKHLWGPRDYYKSDYYMKNSAHFASEMGYYGCPSPNSIEKFISPDKLWPWQDNEEWWVHAVSMELDPDAFYAFRIKAMADHVKTMVGNYCGNLNDFALASQISQAEAVKFIIERFRMTKWRRTGILWWNLLDCWPQFSDAVVDYYFNKKLAYSVIKRSQQPVCLMFSETEKNMRKLVGVNAHLYKIPIQYKVTDITDNVVLAEGKSVLSENATTNILNITDTGEMAHFHLIEWEINGVKYKNHYLSGKPPYDFKKLVEWYKKAEILDIYGFEKEKI